MVLFNINLDESSKLPLYHQLAEQLCEIIQRGNLKPGDVLPSEREICDKFNVSRGTVRQAINNLVSKGYVSRKQGKGTVIKHPVLDHDLIGDYSFGKGMLRQGLKVSSAVLFSGVIIGKKRITNRLALSSKAKLIKISRIRFANDEPWIIEDSYLPEERFSGLETYDFTSHLLVEVLANVYYTRLSRIEAYIEPTLAGEINSKLLGIDVGSPALVLDRVLYDEKGIPVVCGQAFVRGDRCRYYFKINR
ncbi:transcriptional regulator [Desulfocucumis palustris]|uniref:Transcriptional regulator n=1 Tax=Desulfocucumis palustris TaxID=1898651 RepID=A0A2L2XBR9_9FIRM|nr:GntR family transcriptional regulator [Desulfocucumis palustris]GBF33668.1 transcriptional regulator [Desulfocucumis palustris]